MVVLEEMTLAKRTQNNTNNSMFIASLSTLQIFAPTETKTTPATLLNY
jgi:hypothetical protein